MEGTWFALLPMTTCGQIAAMAGMLRASALVVLGQHAFSVEHWQRWERATYPGLSTTTDGARRACRNACALCSPVAVPHLAWAGESEWACVAMSEAALTAEWMCWLWHRLAWGGPMHAEDNSPLFVTTDSDEPSASLPAVRRLLHALTRLDPKLAVQKETLFARCTILQHYIPHCIVDEHASFSLAPPVFNGIFAPGPMYDRIGLPLSRPPLALVLGGCRQPEHVVAAAVLLLRAGLSAATAEHIDDLCQHITRATRLRSGPIRRVVCICAGLDASIRPDWILQHGIDTTAQAVRLLYDAVSAPGLAPPAVFAPGLALSGDFAPGLALSADAQADGDLLTAALHASLCDVDMCDALRESTRDAEQDAIRAYYERQLEASCDDDDGACCCDDDDAYCCNDDSAYCCNDDSACCCDDDSACCCDDDGADCDTAVTRDNTCSAAVCGGAT